MTRLAEVYKERHEWEKAYVLYHQNGDVGLLADLVEEAGTALVVGERLLTLQAWLDDLPATLIESRPRLLSLKGAYLDAVGDSHTAQSLQDQAILKFEQVQDLPALALAYSRRATSRRFLGDYAGSLEDATQSLILAQDAPDLIAIRAEAERLKGLNNYRLGQMAGVVTSLETSLDLYEQLKEEPSVGRLQMELGMVYKSQGENTAAFHVYQQALKTFRKSNNLLLQSNVLNNLGVMYHQQGDYEQAVRSFEEGAECARLTNAPRSEALLLTSLGDAYIDLDEYESAGRTFTSAAEILTRIRYQFLSNYLRFSRARLSRLKGQFKEARSHLNEVEKLIHSTGSNYEHGLFHLEYGCLHLAEEKPANAIHALERALDYFHKGDLTEEANTARIWLAAACLSRDDHAAARSHLQALFETAPQPGGSVPLLQAIRRVLPGLTRLQDDVEVGSRLIPWLTRISQFEDELPLLRKRLRRLLNTVPLQAPHLSIQAFGKAHVKLNGKLVTMSQWKTVSVRELFFFVLASSHPLTKEEIGEVLWPGMDANQLKLRFKNDLYRLRHALGQDIVLFDDNHYHFNHLLDYEYDVEIFSGHLSKAAAAPLEERVSHLHAAAAIRSGPYLQEFDATWVWPERERLDRACTDLLKQLAESQRALDDFKSALASCRQALKIDPCREDIHCLAMQLHADLGDRLSVVWQYQALRSSLHSELDLVPSNETEMLYHRLTA